MTRLIRRLVAASVMALAVSGAVAAPATADPAGATDAAAAAGREDCDPGNFCAWVNPGFNDGPGQWYGNTGDYFDWPHASCGVLNLRSWNNCASSVFNNGRECNVRLFELPNYNYNGAYLTLPRGSYLADLRADRMTDGGHANDRISSHRWCV